MPSRALFFFTFIGAALRTILDLIMGLIVLIGSLAPVLFMLYLIWDKEVNGPAFTIAIGQQSEECP